MSIFERQLGDAWFVQFAQSFRNHSDVLFLGRARQRQIETEAARKFERDPAIFGGKKPNR
jgi:hypothetical protein